MHAMNTPTRPTALLKKLDQSHHLHPFTDLHAYSQNGGRIYSHAEHIYISDTDGNQILDGMSGLWCCNLGYSQNNIIEAIYEQLQQLPYYNNFFNCSNQPAIELAKALVDITPAQFSHVFYTNSGSEANDTNIKLVHRYYDLLGKPQKKQIISRHNAYHGSTIAAGSLGGMNYMHKQYIGLSYVHHISQPYWFGNADLSEDKDAFGIRVARELEAKIDELGEENVAAFIAEPIQGAGGVIVPPDSYWPEVKRICEERDILLIADEVICGFGRMGELFGSEHYDIKPDLITFAKAVTNGYMPLGGVMVGDRVADVLLAKEGEFNHGLTYSGHPAACAAGIETLKVYSSSSIVEDAGKTVGPYLQAQLREFEDHPIVGEVRGMGMFAGIELVKDKSSRERLAPDSAGAIYCRNVAIENGLMLRATGDAMIMSPPLICNQDEIDSLVDKLAVALDQTAKHYSATG